MVQPTPATDPPRAGVMTRAVLRTAGFLGLSDRQRARVIGVSPSTISRMNVGKAELGENTPPWQLAVLLVRLYRSLGALVGSDEQARLWLKAGNHHLAGVPLERIQNIEGLVDVVRYLDAMRGRI